ncbi:YVTN family beta-propeller repeat protein [Mycolicibacterium vinylchloridicum]|uniref:YVTN family beta-propeller repeat protein n=1 Tax=Mycolicibacterium vinylchloridicum TaxID=2736928 RepID=UPI0015C71D82|nr:beta-propeller fold lactonase family protein [Mycolicibacterium vinylchloridicum]
MIATIPNVIAGTVVVSPDGRSVYVTRGDASGYALLSINPTTGASTVIGSIPVGRGSFQTPVAVFSPDSHYAYVAAADGRSVSVIDTRTSTVTATVPIGGYGLSTLAVSPDSHYAYVVAGDSASRVLSLSVISPVTGTVTATIPIGYDRGYEGAVTLGTSPDGHHVYVTTNTGFLGVVDTTTNTGSAIARPDGHQFLRVVASPDSQYAYADIVRVGGYEDAVLVINSTTGVSTAIPIGNTKTYFGLVVSPDSRYAYIANWYDGTVSVINPVTGTATAIPVGSGPSSVAVSPDSRYVYVTNASDGTVSVINPATNTAIATIPVGNGPTSVVVSPDSRHAYVTNAGDRTVSIIDPATRTAISIPVGKDPGSLVVNGDGTRLYVVNSGDNTVSVINITSRVVTTVLVGNHPSRVTLSPDGTHAYITNMANNSLSVIGKPGSSGGGSDDGSTNPIDVILGSLDASNELTKWITNLSKVYDWSALLKGASLVQGVIKVADGLSKGDLREIGDGVTDILSVPLLGPVALVVSGVKLLVSIFYPMSDEQEEKFFSFRVRCMFHKNQDDLTPKEAQQLVDRYSLPGILVNLPVDYAKYNVGGFFGHSVC